MNVRLARCTRKVLTSVGLGWALLVVLVVAIPSTAWAATGDWTGTVGMEFTRTEVHEHFIGHGPDLTWTATDDHIDIGSVQFSAASRTEFGALFECLDVSTWEMTSHEDGGIVVGSSGTSLLVQTQLDGYETLTTQTITGPPESCVNGTFETPNTFQVNVRGTFVTLLSPDQEAASGSVVLQDDTGGGVHETEVLTYAVHRDCTGFDADGDGLADCAELDLHTDPSNPDTDGDLVPDGEDPAPTDPTIPDENGCTKHMTVVISVTSAFPQFPTEHRCWDLIRIGDKIGDFNGKTAHQECYATNSFDHWGYNEAHGSQRIHDSLPHSAQRDSDNILACEALARTHSATSTGFVFVAPSLWRDEPSTLEAHIPDGSDVTRVLLELYDSHGNFQPVAWPQGWDESRYAGMVAVTYGDHASAAQVVGDLCDQSASMISLWAGGGLAKNQRQARMLAVFDAIEDCVT